MIHRLLMLLVVLSTVFLSANEKQKVPFVADSGFLGVEFYQQQAALWQSAVENDPADENAWFNYLLASDYQYMGNPERQNNRRELVQKVLQAIPNTFTAHYFHKRFGDGGFEALHAAYLLDPDNPTSYTGHMVHYRLEDDSLNFRLFAEKYYQCRRAPANLLNLNYNMLQSAPPNALLFTNGDNDTFPAWVLQTLHAVRPDVTVINLHLAWAHTDYLLRSLSANGINLQPGVLPESDDPRRLQKLCSLILAENSGQSLVFALTVNRSYFLDMSDSLYVTGLVQQYSQEPFDNLTVLRKNLEDHLLLDHLQVKWYPEGGQMQTNLQRELNLNYLLPVLMLCETYQRRGKADQAQRWNRLARQIAGDANQAAAVEKWQKIVRSTLDKEI